MFSLKDIFIGIFGKEIQIKNDCYQKCSKVNRLTLSMKKRLEVYLANMDLK